MVKPWWRTSSLQSTCAWNVTGECWKLIKLLILVAARCFRHILVGTKMCTEVLYTALALGKIHQRPCLAVCWCHVVGSEGVKVWTVAFANKLFHAAFGRGKTWEDAVPPSPCISVIFKQMPQYFREVPVCGCSLRRSLTSAPKFHLQNVWLLGWNLAC